MKNIDWNAEQTKARNMSDTELRGALEDAVDTAVMWDEQRTDDHDGNAGFYHDQASVYRAELKRRGLDTHDRAANAHRLNQHDEAIHAILEDLGAYATPNMAEKAAVERVRTALYEASDLIAHARAARFEDAKSA